MKKLCILAITATLFFGSWQLSKPAWALEDAIIAIVNDELITLKDLRDYIKNTYASLVASGMATQQLQAVMLDLEVNGVNKLVEDKLILSRANALGLTVRDQVIAEKIDEIKKRYQSEQEFTEALIQNGATLSDMQKRITDQYKIQYVIDYDVRSKININPRKVTEYYEENMKSFLKKDRINLESIYIAKRENRQDLVDKIAEIKKGLAANEPFETLIKKYSDTPSLGVVERGQLMPEIEKVVFGLVENQVSEPIETETGTYIFKLTGKKPSEFSLIEEVRDQINDMLFKKEFQKRFKTWLTELKEDAYVEIKN